MKTSSILFFFLLALTAFCFVKKTDDIHPLKKITLFFITRLGNERSGAGRAHVKILGDTINVERFRYYVSNFSVKMIRGIVVKLPVEYFLIDEENPQSKSINIHSSGYFN
jgi:hypothetical protein